MIRQAHIILNLDDQGVICVLDGRLFCQKMVAIYDILPKLFLSTLKYVIGAKYCQTVPIQKTF